MLKGCLVICSVCIGLLIRVVRVISVLWVCCLSSGSCLCWLVIRLFCWVIFRVVVEFVVWWVFIRCRMCLVLFRLSLVMCCCLCSVNICR